MAALPKIRNEVSLGNLISSLMMLGLIVGWALHVAEDIAALEQSVLAKASKSDVSGLSERVERNSLAISAHDPDTPHGEARDQFGSINARIENIIANQIRLEAKVDRLIERERTVP